MLPSGWNAIVMLETMIVQGEETSEEALLKRALAMSMDRWGAHSLPVVCSATLLPATHLDPSPLPLTLTFTTCSPSP